MKLKSLLLGSATAIAVAGGAQAADLSVAEPVDYVRVCDAFGTGYWYIPGTDTCLKLSGFVGFSISTGATHEDFSNWEDHYNFNTEAYLTVSAKSMTDWGPLEGFMAFYTDRAGAAKIGPYGEYPVGFDEAYISLGPLLVGYTTTGFAQWSAGTAGIIHGDGNQSGWMQGDPQQDLIRLTWAMNGFGFLIELDQPGYLFHPGSGPFKVDPYSDEYASAMPDIIAALTASTANFDGKISAVWSDYTNGWAVSAGVVIKLDSIAAGDKLLLKAAYGNNAPIYVLGYAAQPWTVGTSSFCGFATCFSSGAAWSASAAFQHYFAPNLYMAALVNYGNWATSGWGSHSQFRAAFNVGYSPAPNLWIVPEVRWLGKVTNSGSWGDSYWDFVVRARRGF